MTITGMAKQLHVSTMTIYRRLQRKGVKLESLRDADGELTAEGVAVIGSLFDGVTGVTGITDTTTDGVTGDATSVQQVIEHVAEQATTDEPEAAAVTIAVLRAKLDAANAQIEMLEREREQLVMQLGAAAEALRREQEDRQHERQLLLPDGQRGRGLLSRIAAVFHGKQQTEPERPAGGI